MGKGAGRGAELVPGTPKREVVGGWWERRAPGEGHPVPCHGSTGGCARPEWSLSQVESPPSWPSTTMSLGPKQTCPSRRESACRSSTTRECPCPCSQAHMGGCHLPPSRGAPEPGPRRASSPRGWVLKEECAKTHMDAMTCPRTSVLETIICLLPRPPGPVAGHRCLAALSPSHLCLLASPCPPVRGCVPAGLLSP